MTTPLQTVAGRTLANCLRITYETLRTWEQLRPVDPKASQPRYAYGEIDAFLRLTARGFAVIPTANDLLDGCLRLLGSDEALLLAPRMTKVKLQKRARQLCVASLKVNATTTLYSRASVLELAADPPESYTTAETCHILGLRNWRTANDTFVPDRLQVITDPDNLNQLRVPRQSLLALLSYQLPQQITPEEWMDERQASKEWLLQKVPAARYAAVSVGDILDLTTDGMLDFIWSPAHTERWITPESLLMFVEGQEVVTEQEIAHIFGVSRQAVSIWSKNGLLVCRTHQHDPDYRQLHRACVVALLRQCLSPGIKAGLWFVQRQQTAVTLMPLAEAAKILGMTQAALTRKAESGEIGGIRTPTGVNWSFSRQRIVRLERRTRRE